MWGEQFTNMLYLVVMASLCRLSWELSRQRSSVVEQGAHKASVMGSNPSAAINPRAMELTPLQKEWAEKAVKRYAEAQEKKWRRWNDAMFERK